MSAAHRARLVVLAIAGASACTGDDAAEGGPMRISAIEPVSSDFRTPARVTVRGGGFVAATRVFFGGTEQPVVERGADSLVVQLPAKGAPARLAVEVRTGDEVARAKAPFVFHGMAPEALLFVDAGAIADVTAERALAGDLDGDGRMDLVAITAAGSRLLLNGGSLRFTPGASTDAPALALGPSKGGRPALLVQSAGAFESARLEGEGFARKPIGAIASATALSAGGDGRVFVVGAGAAGRALFALEDGSDGIGSTEVMALGAYDATSLASGDIDGDGVLDLVLGGRAAGPRVLLADGHGAFAEAPAELLASTLPGSVQLADLDGDGAPELLVSAPDGERVLRRANGHYADRTDATLGSSSRRARTVALVDLDLDAAADRIAASPGLVLERNDGTGRLFDYTSRAAGAVRALRPILAADLDGDMDADLVALDGAGRLHVLENWAPNPTHDGDHDGIPTSRDVCPHVPDPDQRDSDAFPFSCTGAADCAAQTGCTLAPPGDDRAWLTCATPRDFASAERFCASRGARLAVPRDAPEAQALATLLGRAWVGLSDGLQEGAFVDTAGSTPGYTPWRAGEPNDSGGDEDCAETDETGGWNDIPCTLTRAFACEDVTERTPDGVGDACDVCPLVNDPGQQDSDANGRGDACEVAP